jgi:hypothetical protein
MHAKRIAHAPIQKCTPRRQISSLSLSFFSHFLATLSFLVCVFHRAAVEKKDSCSTRVYIINLRERPCDATSIAAAPFNNILYHICGVSLVYAKLSLNSPGVIKYQSRLCLMRDDTKLLWRGAAARALITENNKSFQFVVLAKQHLGGASEKKRERDTRSSSCARGL